ncbi:integral membrane sensor signal transduction histidine kinase [Gluconacetobacter diazotrophicus PA1 5]|uniref:histidine kinase n=2 Tax=Gluconacetobacter diazotrophicus TaxID=33996 RepID=A9HG63_GLUDA|nr:HAMP domain-containing sensor histidine kinase [Gluconacetobacter diazotrophicus]ACI51965.1 integral membrane sensor signal transduction histidine kinase [Gluconacetobacter diazotrophicus PA1 5]TWB05130.1 two-component system OmpR family sensor kinase [Gluconacetobacter diazotrophicus]CAP55454.1 putative sensor histidine kinase [Gluconacetobacter diazotrophicus PA1 5]
MTRPAGGRPTGGRWSLATRIMAGVLVVVLGCLMLLSVLVAGFTRYEVTERLDNSLQEVAERLEFVIAAVAPRPHGGTAGDVALLPQVGPRTLAYQIAAADGHLVLRSQNAPASVFVPSLRPGFYDRPRFRVYVVKSSDGGHTILVGEPTFHRREAVRRATLISVLPMVVFLPCVWLLVRWVVRRALRPLTDLQAEIRVRGGGNLAPIPALDLPGELSAIHAAVNSLLDRLKKALSSERAFAANAAHELRNPIGALLGQAQMLREQLHEPEAPARAAAMIAQIRRLGRMTEKLLQLSRASSGAAMADDRFDLVAVLQILAEEFQDMPPAFREVIVTCDGIEALFVRGDMDAAGILFRNLIENAAHHGTPGTPITVMLTRGGVVEIINDCAPLPPDILGHLTEPFVRGGSGADGSGLGLAIVASIAGQMGARLDIASPVPGEFRVRVAVKDVASFSEEEEATC